MLKVTKAGIKKMQPFLEQVKAEQSQNVQAGLDELRTGNVPQYVLDQMKQVGITPQDMIDAHLNFAAQLGLDVK